MPHACPSRMRRGTLLPAMALLALSVMTVPHDAGAQDVYVPEDLEPWRDWVLHDREYRDCPFFYASSAANPQDFVCAWPDRLNLEVIDGGARFTQSWTVDAAPQWVPLPGSERHWPADVTVGGAPAAVVLRNGRPQLRLAPGRHAIAGRFAWEDRPGTLPIPDQVGLIALNVSGVAVGRLQRSNGSLWLGDREAETQSDDSLAVQVYRRVSDDIPTRLDARLRLDVSGAVREEVLRPLLPEGFVPLAIRSPLPTRLEPDGGLRVQLRPGSWTIEVAARADDVRGEITLPQPEANMPDEEIWSYANAERLRVTVAEGLAPVDPNQAGVPPMWAELPAYRVTPGAALAIAERSRGRVATENTLELERELWLDFDGNAFTAADTVTGEMRSEWRLDMRAPFRLLSASAEGDSLLVTEGGDNGTGIELRARDVQVDALSRTAGRGKLPVSGWLADFDDVATTLYLPPGHKLLAATGADSSSSGWVNRWELLDFFLVLITAVAAARLFGPVAGGIALVALVLSLHEASAVRFAWLNALAAVALARVAVSGRIGSLARLYRAVSIAVVVLLLVPFVAGQLRIALYPQLEAGGMAVDSYSTRDLAPYGAGEPGAMVVPAPRAPEAEMDVQFDDLAPAEIVVTGSRGADVSFSRYAPNAVVQVGPGEPSWRMNRYRLNWSGPVTPELETRLVILPRGIVTLLRFLMVALIGLFAALIAIELLAKKPAWVSRLNVNARPGQGTAATLIAALLVATTVVPSDAQADTPSAEILQQLERRLLEPPDCTPRCADVTRAAIEVSSDSVQIDLQAAALESVALSLPGSLATWVPTRIMLDGRPAEGIYRSGNDLLWIRLPEGNHEIRLEGALPPADSIEIPFATPPRSVSLSVDGWVAGGVDAGRLVSGALTLTRLREGDGEAAWESTRLPAFTRIERFIALDLDWRVTTTVHRVAPEQGAINLAVPLLPGEAVTTEGLEIENGAVNVSMGPTQQILRWESTLERSSPLELTAPADADRQVVWDFAVGAIWHAEFAGLPESETADAGGDYLVTRFNPRPGESLTLSVDRPEATSGDTLVFEAVSMGTEAGQRSRTTTLDLEYRATRGQQHAIRLPDDAEVSGVTVDGATSPIRPEDGVLQVPILPGEHNISIEWQDPVVTGFTARSPIVDLGAGASNLGVEFDVPRNRWILLTRGPDVGPAVLYWSELAALLIAALILARSATLTPLGTRQWILLGIGFSTFSWTAFGVVAGWLLLTGYQQKLKAGLDGARYNLVQVGVAVTTVVALITLLVTLPVGLLGRPDMHITGNGSFGNSLNWFADRSDGLTPETLVVSLPMWCYQALILLWALWLSFALLRWLPWAWREFSSGELLKPWRPAPAAAGTKQG